MSPSAATKAVRTSALGDDISQQIAAEIRRRLPGVEVPTFGALRTYINQVANRGLADILSPEDGFFLADRIGADVVVLGRIVKTIDNRYKKLKEISIVYEARDLRTGASIAVAPRKLSAGHSAVQSLTARQERGGQWRLGIYAQPFPVSLDREVKFVTIRSIQSLLGQAGETLKGRRIAVAPTRTVGFRDLAVDDFLRAFNEEWASLSKKANPWTGGDARELALDQGPVTVMGTQYRTLRDARDQVRVLQRQAKLSTSGKLSEEVTGILHEELRQQAGATMTISLQRIDRRSIEDFIAREQRIYQAAGSIDPETIAHLRTEGAEFLLVSSFEQRGIAYTLKAFILDMATGNRVGNGVDEVLDARLTSEIGQRF